MWARVLALDFIRLRLNDTALPGDVFAGAGRETRLREALQRGEPAGVGPRHRLARATVHPLGHVDGDPDRPSGMEGAIQGAVLDLARRATLRGGTAAVALALVANREPGRVELDRASRSETSLGPLGYGLTGPTPTAAARRPLG